MVNCPVLPSLVCICTVQLAPARWNSARYMKNWSEQWFSLALPSIICLYNVQFSLALLKSQYGTSNWPKFSVLHVCTPCAIIFMQSSLINIFILCLSVWVFVCVFLSNKRQWPQGRFMDAQNKKICFPNILDFRRNYFA